MNKKYLGILALFGAVIFWGPAPVISKLALNEMPQLSFAFLSRTLAFIILFILFFRKGHFKIDRKDVKTFILAGLLGAVFNVTFFLYGIKLTRATDAQAIFTVGPVINAVFAHFILKEKIRIIQMVGVAVGFFGAIIISLEEFLNTGKFHSGNLFGNLLIFLAAVSWVFYIIVSKKLSKKYTPITITSYSFLVASVAFLPLALVDNLNNSGWMHTIGFAGIFGVMYQAIFASVAAFLLYQIGIRATSAFMAGVILYLGPVATTIFAVPILGEKITPPFIVGTIFIVVGSAIATQYDLVKHHVHKHINRLKR